MKNQIEFIKGLLNYFDITDPKDIDLTSEDISCIFEALELLKEHYEALEMIKDNKEVRIG